MEAVFSSRTYFLLHSLYFGASPLQLGYLAVCRGMAPLQPVRWKAGQHNVARLALQGFAETKEALPCHCVAGGPLQGAQSGGFAGHYGALRAAGKLLKHARGSLQWISVP